MLRIPITSLKPGVHEFDLHPAAGDLELDPGLFRDLHVHVILDYHANRILAALHVHGVATLECDRTLEPYDQKVEGTHHVLFAAPDATAVSSDETGEVDEEVRLLHPADQEIDLTKEARDTLVLALPTRRVSPGAEDLDIPTRFGGSEDGIDPRWESLRDLRPDNDQ